MYVNIHMCTNVYHVRNLVTSNRGGVKSRALSYSSFTLLIKRYAQPAAMHPLSYKYKY